MQCYVTSSSMGRVRVWRNVYPDTHTQTYRFISCPQRIHWMIKFRHFFFHVSNVINTSFSFGRFEFLQWRNSTAFLFFMGWVLSATRGTVSGQERYRWRRKHRFNSTNEEKKRFENFNVFVRNELKRVLLKMFQKHFKKLHKYSELHDPAYVSNQTHTHTHLTSHHKNMASINILCTASHIFLVHFSILIHSVFGVLILFQDHSLNEAKNL